MLTHLKFLPKVAFSAAATLFGNAPLMAMQSPATSLPRLDAVLHQLAYYTPEIAFTASGLSFALILYGTFIHLRRTKKRGLPADQD
ncbi:hypothetical protein ACFQ4C_29820 [Larkinella insperata]|uniref:Uncharacterized protein n=1 Tax=Larkinella insperata TaxID=332158 RepID=A0ABW3QGS9_9BACT